MLFLNRSFDKKRLKALLLWFRLNLSEGAALKAVEILQELGFRSATQGAISLGLDDLKTPASKGGRVFQAQVEVALANHEHHRGNRTPVELFQHLVDTWHRTSQDLTTEVIQLFHSTERVNPVYMMAFSGARGNISQVRQLVGMRGLMADPRGQIVGFPILSNFREGLTITEYFVSCYGARKGVVDTAIRTADAGYLTRRLADVSHHVVVRTTNCGTHRNIQLRDIKEGQKTILSLSNRLVGRVLAEHIFMPPKTIIYSNSEITPSMASTLASKHSEVSVRSPLSCSLPWGVCQLCYGWGLSEGRRVTLGEAVGIIAAQSIGEPGTQLTLRTFHTGGVFSGELLNEIRAPYAGNIFFSEPLQGVLLRTPHGQIAFLTKVPGKMKIIQASEIKSSTSLSSILPLEEKTVIDHAFFPPPSCPKASISSEGKDLDQKFASVPSCPETSHEGLTSKMSEATLPSEGKDKKQIFDVNEQKQIDTSKMSNVNLYLPKEEGVSKREKDPTIAKNKENTTDGALDLNEIKDNQGSEFFIQPSTVIFVKQREYVYQNQLLAEFSSSNLQSANDQIEITQQVLSETAGQIWFKEIDYGNRKGPGSGSLGTHFSSQKLGGIWVLAGKPMPNTLSFTICCPSDQPKKAFSLAKSFYQKENNENNDMWVKTIQRTFINEINSSLKEESNFSSYSTIGNSSSVACSFGPAIEGKVAGPKEYATLPLEGKQHKQIYTSYSSRKGVQQSYTYKTAKNTTNTTSDEDKEKCQIENQTHIYETQQNIYESEFSIRENYKISVINLQNDSHIINIKYNYVAGYSFVSHERSIGFMERLYNKYRKPFYLAKRKSTLLITLPTCPLVSKG